MVKFRMNRLDRFSQRREVALIQNRLHQLRIRHWSPIDHAGPDPLSVPGRPKTGHTYIALQIIITNVRLDAHEVPQHPPHDVLPKDNNLLVEELYPTRVGC